MSRVTSRSALQLLAGAETLGRQQNLEAAFSTVTRTALEFLGGRYGLLYQVGASRSGILVHPLGWCLAGQDEEHWQPGAGAVAECTAAPLLAECHASASACKVLQQGNDYLVAFAVGASGRARWLLEIHTPTEPSRQALDATSLFLRCFHNHHTQWEYANLDTLTRLLNRKTFEDHFDQLISEAARTQGGDRSLGPEELARPCWLGVIDIDHFKRVNDNFGHLFGDEVLLRVAELMRKSFRGSDRLFRFGGEEFVAMIYHASDEDVGNVFDRFRRAVEEYSFPQIGQVTCSVGFVRIDPQRLPADLLGRADEALYFSKENGRNQVNGHDELVAQGLLSQAEEAASDALQAEIDELFG